jgi:putative transposase
VRETLGSALVSERRACLVLGQARSTHRQRHKRRNEELLLVERLVELATEYGRYGYRRVTALLRDEGWQVNHKRVERLWRREGLKVPERQPKRRKLWLTDGSCVRLRPAYKDHVWSYDFVAARTSDGRPLRMLTLLDEFSRECLAIDVGRQMTSDDVLERLSRLFAQRGAPRLPAVGQRLGVHGENGTRLAGAGRGEDAVHRAGQPLGERLHRVLQRQAAG